MIAILTLLCPVFDMLRDQLHMVFYMIPAVIQGKVSLDRVSDFLRKVLPLFLLESFVYRFMLCTDGTHR